MSNSLFKCRSQQDCQETKEGQKQLRTTKGPRGQESSTGSSSQPSSQLRRKVPDPEDKNGQRIPQFIRHTLGKLPSTKFFILLALTLANAQALIRSLDDNPGLYIQPLNYVKKITIFTILIRLNKLTQSDEETILSGHYKKLHYPF